MGLLTFGLAPSEYLVDALLGEAQRLAYCLGRHPGVFGCLDRFRRVAPQPLAVAV